MKCVRRPSRTLAGATLLAVLCGSSLGHAHAMINTCRTDPLIHLSDGGAIDLYAQTGLASSAISGVYYTLHVPARLRVSGITYDQYASLEHLTIVADQEPGSYILTTNVRSSRSPVFYTHIDNQDNNDQGDGWQSQTENSVTNTSVTVDFQE